MPVALKLRTDRDDRRESGIWTILSSTAGLHTPIFSQAANSSLPLQRLINRRRNAFKGSLRAMKQAQGITEQLKAENAFDWIGRMNNILACAREIVNEDIILV